MRPMLKKAILPVIATGLIAAAAIAPSQAKPAAPNYNLKVKAVINVYCASCHTGPKAEDGIDFSKFKTEADAKKNKALWMKVKKTLTKKSMPPKGQPQLNAAKRNGIIEWIDSAFPAK